MRWMLSFGIKYESSTHSGTSKVFLLPWREKLLFMRKNQGLISWVAHAMETQQVSRGILATSLVFKACIFIACDDRSQGNNGLLGLQTSMGYPCSIGKQKWRTMESDLVLVSLFGKLTSLHPTAHSQSTLSQSLISPSPGLLASLFSSHLTNQSNR